MSLNQVLSLIGFGMIVYSIIAFDKTTPFPSLYALIPTIGTGLLILCAVPKTFVHRLLSLKYIVGIGLISYSAYLWHQPVFAFVHIIGIPSSSLLYFALILISLFLAYISWRFVEKPFRSRSTMSKKVIFTFSALGISFFVSIGILFSSFNGFADRSPSYVEIKQELDWPATYNRTEECLNLYGGDQYCLISDIRREPTHLLLGDSHANHFYFGLNKVLTEGKDNLVRKTERLRELWAKTSKKINSKLIERSE